MPTTVLRTTVDKTLVGKVEVRYDHPSTHHADTDRLIMDYGTALNLHAQLGSVLGLSHPTPSSPLTASKATTNPRGDQAALNR